jgi:hypothetical protein
MGTNLDVDAMRALIDRHATFEQAFDWEGALGTMVDDPYYEFYPFRLRVSGPEAITRMWIRIFRPGRGILHCYDQSFSVPGAARLEEYLGDDAIMHLMGSRFVAEDGETRASSQIVRYAFEGDRMASETLYVDRSVTPYFDEVFDEEFCSLPGVELI